MTRHRHQQMLLSLLAFILVLCSFSIIADASWVPLSVPEQEIKAKLRPRKIALLIGINDTRPKHWKPLKYARRDALRMADTLQRVAGFDRILLRTRKKDTTRGALLRSLLDLRAHIRSPQDLLVVYISAHGTLAMQPNQKRAKRYIVASDTTRDVHKSALSLASIVRTLKTLPSKRTLLMLATCYTGTTRSKAVRLFGRKGKEIRGLPKLQPKAVQILSAAGFAQAAYESHKLRSDVYTHFFLRCMKKLHRSHKDVSAIDAHLCATQPTANFVKTHRQAVQVPRVDSQFGANRDVFLLQRKKTKVAQGYFWAGRRHPNIRFRVQPASAPMRKKGFSTSPHWMNPGEYLSLRPGRYVITIHNAIGFEERRYTITIRRQQITQIGAESLPTLRQQLRTARDSRSVIRGLGYGMSGTLMVLGGSMLTYGAFQDQKVHQIVGGMFVGISSVWFTIMLMGDLAVQSNIRRLRYQLKIDPQPGPRPGAPYLRVNPSPLQRSGSRSDTLLDLE